MKRCHRRHDYRGTSAARRRVVCKNGFRRGGGPWPHQTTGPRSSASRYGLLVARHLGDGVTEPIRKMRRTEARMTARGEALIVQSDTVIEGVRVGGHRP